MRAGIEAALGLVGEKTKKESFSTDGLKSSVGAISSLFFLYSVFIIALVSGSFGDEDVRVYLLTALGEVYLRFGEAFGKDML